MALPWHLCSWVALGLALISGTSPVSATVTVYDNTTTPTTGTFTEALQQGFWPFSVYLPYEFMGDSINLVSTERTICQFVLMLSSSEPTMLDTLTVRFYDQDGPWPDTLIWSSMVSDVCVNGITAVSFEIEPPYVTVPDSLTWAAAADSMVAGLATFDPPTVGSSDNYWFDLDPYSLQWGAYDLGDDLVANFGARLVAVPEPTTSMLLIPGTLLAVRRKRCCRGSFNTRRR